MVTKIVQKFGNSGHIVLPKEYVGKRIRFVLGPKSFDNIKNEILEILKPYLENMLGIYLYGSHARNEQTTDSDIDILVITNTKLKVVDEIDDYSIISLTLEELENTLKSNAILILPIIKEAKTIINPQLFKKYVDCTFTKNNTKQFIDSSIRSFELSRKGLELDFEIGSLVYSLILRIRGLLMIKLMLNNRLYSKSALFNYLKDDFPNYKIEEFYRIYSKERNNFRIRESGTITKEDTGKLLAAAEQLLNEVKNSLK